MLRSNARVADGTSAADRLRLNHAKAFAALTTCSVMLAIALPAHGETLEQAWAVAVGVDHRLQASRYTTEATQQALQAARAARWPNVALQGGYTRLNETPTAVSSFTPPAPLPPTQLNLELPLQQPSYYAYKVEVTLPLYTGGRIENGITAAGSLVGAARNDELRTALDVKLAVAQVYLGSLRAARFVEVAQSNVTSLMSFECDVNHLFEQGIVARSDTLAARVALADARQRLIVANNAVDLAHAAYNRLLGRAFTQPVDLQEVELPADAVDVTALTVRAQAQRPELKALSDQGAALKAQAASVRGALAPQVALIGGYGRQQNRYQAHEGIASIGIGLKWELFDGGLVRAQADAIAARGNSVASLREEAVSLIALQVRQAWLGTQEAAQRITVAQAAIDSADENLLLARDRYSQGMATQTEVLEAETQRTRSQTNRHAATYDALLAQLQLRRATGEL